VPGDEDAARADLPAINTILLSHNHYDHMDRRTLEALGRRTPIVCPTGLRTPLRNWGFTRVTELSWGDSMWDEHVRITAVPAQHTSGRGLRDRNRTLWAGWLVECGDRRALFLGDTGYAPFFAEFPGFFGTIDLAMIPIGAYRPAWFMRPLHLSPAEAVAVHCELRSRKSIAMHWGTFQLSDEPLHEPPALLRRHLAERGIANAEFCIPRLNESIRA
jgi:N-acyl-phosphatidylethanolamine-hydrolysing phospholipase D